MTLSLIVLGIDLALFLTGFAIGLATAHLARRTLGAVL